MTLFTFTEADKLRILEQMIANAKQSYRAGISIEDEQFQVLGALAADIKARLPGATEPTLVALENRVQKVRRSSHTRPSHGEHLFYDRDALAAAGTDLVARWPEIRAGLIELAMKGTRR